MKNVILIEIFCIFLTRCLVQSSETQNVNSGYIFTSPRSLKLDENNELTIRRFDNLDSGFLEVQVFYKEKYNSENETIAASQQFELPEGEKETLLNLYVNNIEDYPYNGRIQINGTIGDQAISGHDHVRFSRPQKRVVIIQTDKPIYKPGETVQFRVLKVNKNLKPSKKNNNATAYVEDPKGTRLFQFENLDLKKGLVQREFPLSEEPVLGDWSIKVVIDGDEQSTSFNVKEYVLPKFDVNIKFPSFVLANAKKIPVKICANYTYGKPVDGTLNLNVSLERYYYERNSDNKYPTLQKVAKIDGCYHYVINVSKIDQGNGYSYRKIQVVANVVEKGTGVERTDTEYLRRDTSPLNLEFIDGLDYFKPGLPYNGKVKVTNPDGTISANEPIEICVTINKKRILADWWATKTLKVCMNYTSSNEGLIQYTILPQNMDVISMSLNAKALKYSFDSSQNVLSQPQAFKSLSPFFSPSGSYIQIQPVSQPVDCETKLTLTLLFTSKEDAEYKFFYQVARQGNVVVDDSFETSFSVDEDDVSGKYENEDRVINGNETQLDPSPDSIPEDSVKNCPEAKESRYTPPIGETEVDIDVDTNLAPTIYVLVYYVREDGEVVADSIKIDIENCFKNRVKFSFGDEEKQPGSNTSVQIKAGANSLCGIRAVDKSVLLLDSSNQLTKEKVFQMVSDFDSNQYYANNPCYESEIQPGLENSSIKKLATPYLPDLSSYEDSLTAFQTSGYLIISNLYIFTRPCTRSNGGGIRFNTFSAKADIGPAGRPISILPAASARGGGITVSQNSAVVRTDFPETWLFELEMTDDDGMFEKNVTLPDTITEWVGSAVCINYEEGLGLSNSTSIRAFQAFFIDYTLPISVIRGEEFTAVVSIFSYAKNALPVTVSLDSPDGFKVIGDSIDGDVCIEPDSSVNLPLTLEATKVGKVQITVRAKTAESKNACGDSPVSNSYFADAIRKPIEVEAEGFPNEVVVNSLFCPSDNDNGVFETTLDGSVPNDVVPDSSREYIDFTGNVLGPAINNLNTLVSLPTGCGEQNMVKFTPNYLVLDYLKGIGMLTDSIKDKAIRNLQTGYQRELSYLHDDGSFSAFGESDRTGSMFLSAFVLRSFFEAQRYITIDDNLLKQTQDWIVSKQGTNGCFPNIGRIIDIDLQGGLKEDSSTGAITAYVLASLVISKLDNKTVIDDALNCLKEFPPTNPYNELLYAYTYTLIGEDKEAKDLLDEARQKINRTDGRESFIIVNGTKAIEIETVAYAVLTTLAVGGSASDALPYVRYLTYNLNPNGGFSSTQDTVVGLHALSKFAKIVYKDPLDLMVNSSGGLNESVEITNDNKLLVQRFKVTDASTAIDIVAKGTGCGLIQLIHRYNTKTPQEKKQFSINVMGECLDSNCNQASIEVLVSYLPPDQVAGMSIVEIKLITGFSPVKQSLEDLKSNKNNDILRVDVQDNTVIIYFSEISNKVNKFSIQVNKVVDVKNPQPGIAKVYDYYANERSSSTNYAIESIDSESNEA